MSQRGTAATTANDLAVEMEALGDRIMDGNISEREGVMLMADLFKRLVMLQAAGTPLRVSDCFHAVRGLGVAVTAAQRLLKKRGPVLVRVIDGDALCIWLLPDGPLDPR